MHFYVQGSKQQHGLAGCQRTSSCQRWKKKVILVVTMATTAATNNIINMVATLQSSSNSYILYDNYVLSAKLYLVKNSFLAHFVSDVKSSRPKWPQGQNFWPRSGSFGLVLKSLDLVVLLCNGAFFRQTSCKIPEFC